MLRISVHEAPGALTFQLEGKLVGTWVHELENCWKRATTSVPTRAVRFDVTEVSSIDAAGKAFLAARHAEAAELVVSGCLMRAIVAELTNPVERVHQRSR